MSDTIKRTLEEFCQGCSHAGPRAEYSSDRLKPVTDCEECLEGVVEALHRKKFGNCGQCRFRKPIRKDHYMRERDCQFECKLFPPQPPQQSPGNFGTIPIYVGENDGCFHFEEGDSPWQ